MTRLLVINAPSQWVKFMIPAPAIPGKKYLCDRETHHLMGKDRTADDEVIIFKNDSIKFHLYVFRKQSFRRRVNISFAGIVPIVVNAVGSCQRWFITRCSPSPAHFPSKQPAKLLIRHGWMSSQGDQKIEGTGSAAKSLRIKSNIIGIGMLRVESGMITSTFFP